MQVQQVLVNGVRMVKKTTLYTPTIQYQSISGLLKTLTLTRLAVWIMFNTKTKKFVLISCRGLHSWHKGVKTNLGIETCSLLKSLSWVTTQVAKFGAFLVFFLLHLNFNTISSKTELKTVAKTRINVQVKKKKDVEHGHKGFHHAIIAVNRLLK